MEFTVETYFDYEAMKNMVYISAGDGASGATYPYETAEDIGNCLAEYIKAYYPYKI